MRTNGHRSNFVICVLGCVLSGCTREAPPEVAKFRPPATRAIEEVPEPVAVASASPVVEAKKPPELKPTTQPVATAPVVEAPTKPEPKPEPAPKEPTIIGSWRVTDMGRNGQSRPMGDTEMTYTFAEDGTLTASVSGGQMPEPQTMTGTYTVDGNSLTINMQGQSESGTVTFEGNDRMIIEAGGTRNTLTRS